MDTNNVTLYLLFCPDYCRSGICTLKPLLQLLNDKQIKYILSIKLQGFLFQYKPAKETKSNNK